MNQLSLQVMTWGTVSTVVSTAVWLAMVGDAATLAGAERALAATRTQPAVSRPIRPVVFHPATQPRAPAVLSTPPPKGRQQS